MSMTSSVYEGREVDILFLNSSQAFHGVSFDIFITKLVRYGLDKEMVRKAGWKVATAGIFSILQERSMGYEDKAVLRKVTNKRKSTLYSRGVTTILENAHSSYSHELHRGNLCPCPS
ncbi:hypothetical protein TURU_068949 [Turdus rufiventris]|nr:hypothetical protein TURU_068949 [Turdus rufiventris]